MNFISKKTFIEFSKEEREIAQKMGEILHVLREKMFSEHYYVLNDPDEQNWGDDDFYTFETLCAEIANEYKEGDWEFK